jgi:hypothetical protein
VHQPDAILKRSRQHRRPPANPYSFAVEFNLNPIGRRPRGTKLLGEARGVGLSSAAGSFHRGQPANQIANLLICVCGLHLPT